MEYGGNVRVAVRVRPLNARERLAGSTEVINVDSDGRSILAAPDRHFTFDVVHDPKTSQEAVFEGLARPIVESLIEGFNCTILAYGQTGSGKTFTMGTSIDSELNCESAGIVPRAVHCLTSCLEKAVKSENGEFYEIYVSFLELYNEEIVDLLNANSQDRLDKSKRPVLTIREDNSGAICIVGIKEERAACMEDIIEYLRRGTLCRTTKSTDMNLVSSRSHAIFTITLRQRRLLYDEQGQLLEKMLLSKLHFVDLAGSERLKRTNATGERAKESISINSGLLALGNVISALGDESKKSTHVPYRDSKLTRLLQDSLGGNSKTVMIACISPSSDNYAETVNTLKYANRARNIKNIAKINEDQEGNAVFEIMQLKKQVAALKTEILQLRGLGVRRIEMATPRKVDNDEFGRLRTQNKDLQRRLDALLRDKVAIEAERDFYKSTQTGSDPENPHKQINIIKEHLKTISDLKDKIADLENHVASSHGRLRPMDGPSTRLALNQSPAVSLEVPSWFGKANDLIDRTRFELRNNEAFIVDLRENLPDPSSAIAPKEATVLLNDQTLKEELIVSLENSQKEYLVMRRKYEERLQLLQQNILAVQKERDQALKAVQQPTERLGPRMRLEEKVRQMGKIIEELKAKSAEHNRDVGTKHAANETLARNLRAALQNTKMEKARLQTRLEEVTNRLRSQIQDTKLTELRAKERRASEQAKKYKKAYEFQKNLLHKRSEQYLQSKTRVKTLVNALRKHRVPLSPSIGTLLDTPSLRNLSRPNPLETPILPNRSMSELGSRCVSASDLKVESLSLDPSRSTTNLEIDGGDDDFSNIDSPVLEPNPMNIIDKKHIRRDSLVNKGQPLLAPPGCEVPRSVLRMSPLVPRRKDLFARIADAASLTLATKHLSNSTPISRTNSLETPASPMKIDDDGDIVEFYRSSTVD